METTLHRFVLALLFMLYAVTARAEPALWMARSATATVYLFGTIHTLRGDRPWQSPKIKQALADSDTLWLETTEASDPAALAPLLQRFGIDPAHPLSTKLTPNERRRLEAAANAPGMPTMARLEPMRPWLAGVMLADAQLEAAGYSSSQGVEKALTERMTQAGRKVVGFETAEQQLHYLIDLPQKTEIQILDGAVDDADGGAAQIDAIVDAWFAGDVERIGKLIVEDSALHLPEAYVALLVNRNVAWSRRIQEMLRGHGVSFVAVGAGHLAGPDSVQMQLAKLGIRTERE